MSDPLTQMQREARLARLAVILVTVICGIIAVARHLKADPAQGLWQESVVVADGVTVIDHRFVATVEDTQPKLLSCRSYQHLTFADGDLLGLGCCGLVDSVTSITQFVSPLFSAAKWILSPVSF